VLGRDRATAISDAIDALEAAPLNVLTDLLYKGV
jgi:hypothetical protein